MLDRTVTFLNEQPMLALFAMIALGSILGSVNVRGVSLGSSGVLFVALLFGHWGVAVSETVMSLGVILFVYAVGLQAGPRFGRSLRLHGFEFLLLVAVSLVAAFVGCTSLCWCFGMPPAFAAGLFAGSLTSTPGLAAALKALEDPAVAVGFGAAYPFGALGVILFVQLTPRFLRIDLSIEEENAKRSSDLEPLGNAWFRIQNSMLAGRTVDEISAAHMADTQISRVAKGADVLPAKGATVLEVGDHVRAVGKPGELRRLELLLGPIVDDLPETQTNVATMTLYVTERNVSGRTLGELRFRELYGVNITRICRDDFEFVPHGFSRLEFGDTVRIAGSKADCERIVPVIGHQQEKLRETQFLPLALGLVTGTLVGLAPLPLPGDFDLRLGLAGGPMLVGLVAGHFGRVGSLSFRLPPAAAYFVREIGLLFFLAGAGAAAGTQFWAVLSEQGWITLGIVLTVLTLPLVATFAVSRLILKWDLLTCLGAVCGSMTSTPGLGAAAKLSRTPAASLAYVSIYPAALIGTTILAPVVGLLLTALPTR